MVTLWMSLLAVAVLNTYDISPFLNSQHETAAESSAKTSEGELNGKLTFLNFLLCIYRKDFKAVGVDASHLEITIDLQIVGFHLKS